MYPFSQAIRSADGTTIITSSSCNTIRSFVLPEDLLESRSDPLPLQEQGRLVLSEPSHAIASAPYFALSTPYTQTLLTACRDHPIQLHYALPADPSHPPDPPARPLPVASYPLIKPETEAYLTPTALLWSAPGTHFLAGTTNLLAHFDISRPGAAGPVARLATIPSARHLAKGGGVGMRGTVAALAQQPPAADGAGLVAAGTWTRWVGLYDVARAGACVATWGIAGAAPALGGQGVLQAVWSPCGRYLVLNERKARGLLVYDVRVAGRLLGWLAGRPAATNQRLSCDVFPGAEDGGGGGFEVWAGTDDGTVVVWEGVGGREEEIMPSWDWRAHDSAIGSAAMHSSGSVVATCSGAWTLSDRDGGGPTTTTSEDADLSVWSIRSSDQSDLPNTEG